MMPSIQKKACSRKASRWLIKKWVEKKDYAGLAAPKPAKLAAYHLL